MIPEYQQSIEDILKAATPAQLIMWQQIRLITGQNAAIRQLFYSGVCANSEFEVLTANKLYFAYEFEIGPTNAAIIGFSNITLNNGAGGAINLLMQLTPVWDATAAVMRYQPQQIKASNIIFWQSVRGGIGYSFYKFSGYRIIY